MILAMSRVRILGPRSRLDGVLAAILDLGMLHLGVPETVAPLGPVPLSRDQERLRRRLGEMLTDIDQALASLGADSGTAAPTPAVPTVADLAGWARRARQARRGAERFAARIADLQEERALILKYQYFFTAFRALLEDEARWPNAAAYHVLVKPGDAGTIPALQTSLAAVIGEEFHLYARPLPSGETAVLVVVSSGASQQVERLLVDARVQEIPVPEQFGGGPLAAAIPRMLTRLDQLPGELERALAERAALASDAGPVLRGARVAIHDRLQELDAVARSSATARAFVVEGWVPTRAEGDFTRELQRRCGDEVVVSEVAREDWQSDQAPVVLANPRLFRPFETLIGLVPLPRYGSIDPTPFVAIFFPAFFGLMVGDIGYGVVLAVLGLELHRRAKPGTTLRNVAEIVGPCALAAIIGGVLYGELFGDLGARWIGLKPLLFDREDAIVPFLLLSIGLGVVQVLVGLILGMVSARGKPRVVAGRGVSALMVVLAVLALLAAARVLPSAFFSPAVVALLVAFPVLIALEGIVAMIELVGTLGNILSYARIMALGIASVMLAVVANRMVGALGSVLVGVVFALLFHVVNFAIAMFSPAIHAMRLQYVEFFGKFYSPGGVPYRPLGHWTRAPDPARITPDPARHPA